MEWGDRSGQSEREGAVFTSSLYVKKSSHRPVLLGGSRLLNWFVQWYKWWPIILHAFPALLRLPSGCFHQFQAELKLAEYHKLARKLKLMPTSAENACGHDFEIRAFDCGTSSSVQHKTQIQVLWTSDIVYSIKAYSHFVMPIVSYYQCFTHSVL